MLGPTMAITQFNFCKSICFYKHAHNLRPKGSPDMILRTFYMTFWLKQMGYLPRRVHPKQNRRPSVQARGPGSAAPSGCVGLRSSDPRE